MATTRAVQWTAATVAAGVWSMADAAGWVRVLAAMALAALVGTMIAADADAAKGGA